MRQQILYRMPAEWEPHEGTWLAWPHEKSDWPGKFAPVAWVYGEIVRRLAVVERVHLIVAGAAAEESVRKILRKAHANLAAVDFFHAPTNRSWTRDFCPIFVRDAKGRAVALDWRFNGWAKYDNWGHDDALPERITAARGFTHVQPEWNGQRVVLEGGSIDVNGAGLLMTTEECLLSEVQQRNPGLARRDYEAAFARYLGIRRTLWLKNGIAGDDTHGHVDDLARFVSRDTVVLALEREKGEANYAPTQENWKLLRTMPDLRIVPLPMPEPLLFDGQRLPASYANFYIANRLVLVPTFNDKNDRLALNTLARLFPDREVVGIHAVDLVLGLGTLHCLSQQQIA